MSDPRPLRAFCETFLAALARGDHAAQAAMLHPDFVVREAAGLPYAGDYRGPEGWRALTRAVTATWAGFRGAPLEILGETAESVVVRLAISGRSRRTGRAFETTVLELWRIENGRLREILPYYWDTHALAEADRP